MIVFKGRESGFKLYKDIGSSLIGKEGLKVYTNKEK